jgi:hypothetical protein
MKLEINCYFEPDIAWLGEINRQTLLLERRASVFPASATLLECALWISLIWRHEVCPAYLR